MNCERVIKIVLVFIILILVISSYAYAISKPSWIAPGRYAEYEVIVYSNHPDVPKGIVGTIRWEIKSVHNNYAEIKLTVNVKPSGYYEISLTSGTYKWYYDNDFESGLIIGNESLENLPKRAIIEEKSTPAGTFSCYKVSFSYDTPSLPGYLAGQYKTYVTNWYDKSTGILVAEVVKTWITDYKNIWPLKIIIQLRSSNVLGNAFDIMSTNIMLWITMCAAVIAIVVSLLLIYRQRHTKNVTKITLNQQ